MSNELTIEQWITLIRCYQAIKKIRSMTPDKKINQITLADLISK